jgi:hypothetical protein
MYLSIYIYIYIYKYTYVCYVYLRVTARFPAEDISLTLPVRVWSASPGRSPQGGGRAILEPLIMMMFI